MMTKADIIADLDKSIAGHVDKIMEAAKSGNKQLLESRIRGSSGQLQGLWEAKDIVSRLPE